MSTTKQLTLQFAKAFAEVAWKHARRCKLPLGECEVCQKHIETFNTFPLPILSKVLEEKIPK